MNKIYIILFSCMMLTGRLTAEILSPDISFLDLPLSANSASLGNTYLSDIGNPNNLLLNPANIWFGQEISISKNKFMKNLRPRVSISNFELVENDNSFNLMCSIQHSDKIALSIGYVQNSQSNINHYDENANYLGNIQFKQRLLIVGLASQFSGINLGVSFGKIDNNFELADNNTNSDEVLLTSMGFSYNDIFLRNGAKVYLHATSKNIVYKEDIGRNSLLKNIVGLKYNQQLFDKSYFHFLLDYNSNNDVTNDFFSTGISYEIIFGENDKNSLFLNAGFKESFEQISYGLEYKRFRKADLSISIANVSTAWSSDYYIFSLKYSFVKR